jgi:hypothetical protein
MPFIKQFAKETKMQQWYGVSYGNGNDGVSHFSPNILVYTDDPWTLARAAMIFEWKDKQWANENTDLDHNGDEMVSATIYEGPDGETEFGAAYMIVEVFAVNESEYNCIKYDSIYEAFDKETYEIVQTGIDT